MVVFGKTSISMRYYEMNGVNKNILIAHLEIGFLPEI